MIMANVKNDYAERRAKALKTEKYNLEEQEKRVRGEGNGKQYKKLYQYIQSSLHEAVRKWGEDYVEYVLSEEFSGKEAVPHPYDFTLWKRHAGDEFVRELERRIPEVRRPIQASSLMDSRTKKNL